MASRLLAALAGVILVGATLVAVPSPALDVPGVALFGLASALVCCVGAALPGGDVADGDEAIMVAALLVLEPAEAALAATAGGIVSLVLHESGPLSGLMRMLRRPLLVVALIALRHAMPVSFNHEPGVLLPMAVLGLLYALGDVVFMAAILAPRRGQSPARLAVSILVIAGSMYLAQVSIGLVTAGLYPVLGGTVVVVMTTLVLIMRHSFNSYMRIRTAYRKVIEVLAAASERLIPHKRGHAERVALLALKMGKALGVRGKNLDTLNYAALLHDIGDVDTTSQHVPQRGFWNRSAQIVSTIPFLQAAAPIIELVHNPSGSPLGEASQTSAEIIRLASWLDDQMCARRASTTEEQAKQACPGVGSHVLRAAAKSIPEAQLAPLSGESPIA